MYEINTHTHINIYIINIMHVYIFKIFINLNLSLIQYFFYQLAKLNTKILTFRINNLLIVKEDGLLNNIKYFTIFINW